MRFGPGRRKGTKLNGKENIKTTYINEIMHMFHAICDLICISTIPLR